MVNIYTEPFVDVQGTIYQWFGQPSTEVVTDICIMFSYLGLFVFICCIFAVLFSRK